MLDVIQEKSMVDDDKDKSMVEVEKDDKSMPDVEKDDKSMVDVDTYS